MQVFSTASALNVCDDRNHFSGFENYGVSGGVCIVIGNDGLTSDPTIISSILPDCARPTQATLRNAKSFIFRTGRRGERHRHNDGVVADRVFRWSERHRDAAARDTARARAAR